VVKGIGENAIMKLPGRAIQAQQTALTAPRQRPVSNERWGKLEEKISSLHGAAW
jgi:hypothetical protein